MVSTVRVCDHSPLCVACEVLFYILEETEASRSSLQCFFGQASKQKPKTSFCYLCPKKHLFTLIYLFQRLLHRKRREIDRTITRLRNESTADESSVDKINDLVQERENVKRKLSSTYSLGRDIDASKSKDHVLPLYGGGSRSFSFRNRENESITIFETHRHETSSSEDSYRDQHYDDDDDDGVADDEIDEGDLRRKQKGKFLAHSEGSSSDDYETCGIASSRRSTYLKKRSLSLRN